MSTTLQSRTISSVVDNRLVLNASEARRVLTMGTDWTKLRIGMRYTLNASNVAVLGTASLSIGLCTGTTDGFSRPLSTHAVGVMMLSQQLNPVAVTPHYHVANIAGAFVCAKRIGAVVTSGSAVSSTAPMFVNEILTNRSCFFVEITKGSPNFTFQFGAPTTQAAVQTDITITKFLEQMETPQWSAVGLASWLAGYTTGTAQTLAVDQVTNGNLTTLVVHHNIAGSIEISDVRVSRLA